jgi:putative transposase
MVSPKRKRAAVRHLQAKGLSSQRRACWLVEVSRSSLYYVPRKRPDDDALRARIKQIAEDRQYYGYRLVWGQLRREGWGVNHKRVHRIWREEGLDLRRRPRGKRPCGPKGEVKQRATHPDNVWSYDISEDRTERGRQLRILSVMDEFTRECVNGGVT